ncbi:MAG: hypothetical protein HQK64_04720 [Desulfamplus sp.]|nr:hypothetical protein [Desulfamplus sp.]MBF0390660.1 hypothetical protein [Desulfamplus sp.]
MNAIRIKQTVTPDGIIIPFNTVQQFKGKEVEIIISDTDMIISKVRKKNSLKQNLADVLEKYKEVKPFKNIDPLSWERKIRNEW